LKTLISPYIHGKTKKNAPKATVLRFLGFFQKLDRCSLRPYAPAVSIVVLKSLTKFLKIHDEQHASAGFQASIY